MGKEIDIAFALLRGALDGTVPEVEHMDAHSWWHLFRLMQQNHVYGYDPMDAAKAVQIKEFMIKNGIPGDPLFNWVRRLDL